MRTLDLDSPERFPPMRQQPSYVEIKACLDSLRASKSDDDGDDSNVWDCATPQDEIEASLAANALHVQRYANAVARYLGSIVMSDLNWLPNEDDRESLWNIASRRIAERCGRTAMGDITRRWPLSLPPWEDHEDQQEKRQIDLIIKEPALVGDSLGFKTWGTSYAMACMLPKLAFLPGLCHLQPLLSQGLPVLELGAGTGLLGLAAAALWSANVVLSDLATIVPNLASNAERNAKAIEARGGRARVGVFQWGASREDHSPQNEVIDPTLFPQDHTFPLILAADPIYDEDHPVLLASAIDAQLALDRESSSGDIININGVNDAFSKCLRPRAVVMVPMRDRQTEKLAAMFVAAMAERGLVPVDEGEIAGQDSDWGSGGGAGMGCDFTCLWWVFRRV